MQSVITSEGMALAVDKDSGVIMQASDEDLMGKNILDLGIDEGSLRDGFTDFFMFNGEKWYGCSQARGELIYYSAEPEAVMFGNLWENGLIRALIFLAAYILLAFAALAGYTEEAVDAMGARCGGSEPAPPCPRSGRRQNTPVPARSV